MTAVYDRDYPAGSAHYTHEKKATPQTIVMLTRQGLSRRWIVSIETLKRKEKAGILRAYKIGRGVRYMLADIERIEA